MRKVRSLLLISLIAGCYSTEVEVSENQQEIVGINLSEKITAPCKYNTNPSVVDPSNPRIEPRMVGGQTVYDCKVQFSCNWYPEEMVSAKCHGNMCTPMYVDWTCLPRFTSFDRYAFTGETDYMRAMQRCTQFAMDQYANHPAEAQTCQDCMANNTCPGTKRDMSKPVGADGSFESMNSQITCWHMGESTEGPCQPGDMSCAVVGCTDPYAPNFDPRATVDDGTCIRPPTQAFRLGCTDPKATNYDWTATINDGSCVYPAPPAPMMPGRPPIQDIAGTPDAGPVI